MRLCSILRRIPRRILVSEALSVAADGIGKANLMRLDSGWEAKRWEELKPQGARPPARCWSSATFDPKSRSMLVFGGLALS